MTHTDILKATLQAKGLKYVGVRGNTGGDICLIGEAPGADEDQAGVPFVGAAGRELDRLLNEAGLDPGRCWWTNPYKTRPPDNKLDRLAELGIPDQVYLDQFYEELNVYKPTFIVPLGATPLGLLCPATVNKRTGHAEISKYRGSILRSDKLTWEHYVVPTYHPAFLFRDWSERQIVVLCLARVAEEWVWWRRCHSLQPLPSRQLVSDPGADDAIDYLRSLLAQDSIISIDIENIGVYKGKYKVKQRNRVPYVIGFSTDPRHAMSIGLSEYPPGKTEQIWTLIDQVLQTKRQVGQNYYTHDLPWLKYIGFSPNIQLVEDTLVMHHTLWPELSHKLDFQTFQYTREPYYKSEGEFVSTKDTQKLKRYNCKDVCVTLECYQAMSKELQCR